MFLPPLATRICVGGTRQVQEEPQKKAVTRVILEEKEGPSMARVNMTGGKMTKGKRGWGGSVLKQPTHISIHAPRNGDNGETEATAICYLPSPVESGSVSKE